ncbi:hypothetical protein D0Y65_051069 [Glycine soja]|uniref:Uncharacterized protein n=1 Tax=Glycine soja TaxID=3848 RepID=A0A445FEK4_GLYSO|nr:hypothetical protein D0Y65_051069 [Glycine soja]
MENSKHLTTPMNTSCYLDKDESGQPVDLKQYRVGYSDSDFAGSKTDRKSTNGTCQFIGSALVSWNSKKQNSVALSTAEAEYISAEVVIIKKREIVEAKLHDESRLIQRCFNDNKGSRGNLISRIKIQGSSFQESRSRFKTLDSRIKRRLNQDKTNALFVTSPKAHQTQGLPLVSLVKTQDRRIPSCFSKILSNLRFALGESHKLVKPKDERAFGPKLVKPKVYSWNTSLQEYQKLKVRPWYKNPRFVLGTKTQGPSLVRIPTKSQGMPLGFQALERMRRDLSLHFTVSVQGTFLIPKTLFPKSQ